MIRKKLRSGQDEKLSNELLAIDRIQLAVQNLESKEVDSVDTTKKHLLSTAVRLSSGIAPELLEMCSNCTRLLEVDLPVELYVYSSPQFNAACFKPENEKLYIMFSSSILEAFSLSELCYVLGHELGHYIFGHHSIPIGYLLQSKSRPDYATLLKLFRWSRFAEISADRAGAFCSNSFETTATATFKLSSGLSNSAFAKFDLKSYLGQIDELITHHHSRVDVSQANDWFATHPFSPLRVKALELFFKSSLVDQTSALNADLLDKEVERALEIMDPDYLQGKSKEALALKNLFIASAFLLVNNGGRASKEEQARLHELLGDSVRIDALSKEALETDLPKRIQAVLDVCSDNMKSTLLRDLIKISLIDDVFEPEERDFVEGIAKALMLDFEVELEKSKAYRALD